MSFPIPYFQDVPSYGNLSIEYIIIDDTYPVLFVLTNASKERFICVCCDIRQEQRWIINPVGPEDLYKLLCNNITMLECFLIGQSYKVIAVHSYETDTDSYRLVARDELDTNDLPVSGEFLDAQSYEHSEYIITLLNTNHIDGFRDATSNVRNVSRGETISYTTDLNTTVNRSYVYSNNDRKEFFDKTALLAA